MSEENLAFYERLAREEAEAAAAASSPALASAHRLLSMQYEDCVDQLRATRPFMASPMPGASARPG